MNPRDVIIVLALGCLIIINFLAYGAFYFDKLQAQRNARRVSESSLLTLALLGGSVGAITAQHQFRHKTKKQPFKFLLYTIAALQVLGLFALFVSGIPAEVFSIFRE